MLVFGIFTITYITNKLTYFRKMLRTLQLYNKLKTLIPNKKKQKISLVLQMKSKKKE